MFFKMYQSFTTEKFVEVQIWQPNFRFRSECLRKYTGMIFFKKHIIIPFQMSFWIKQLLTAEKFVKVQIWYPNFRFRQYVSRKIYLNDFLQTAYNNSLLDVFSAKIVVCYRYIGGSPNLVCQFQVSEVILSMKNGSKDFL